MNAVIYFTDKTQKTVKLTATQSQGNTILTLPLSNFENKPVEYVDFAPEYLTTKIGDEGYAIIPCDNRGTVLCLFTQKEDSELVSNGCVMSCFGFKLKNNSILAICKGCENNLRVKLGLKNGIYSLYAHYAFEGFVPYEDITVEYISIPGGDYSDMAHVYRNYQISQKGCIPIKQRARSQPALAKNISSIEIRIRLSWKPAPSPYAVQTPENEPPLHVAMTFDEVYNFAKKLKAAGVENAEICLVGWNKKGHDGRWPQCFPVEEALGGENKLRELIKKVKNLGYSIVGHTNHRDMYKIAETWNDNDVAVNRHGKPSEHPIYWSGGQPYIACPHSSLKFAKDILPKTFDLGFSGIHYIDVLTVLPLHACYSPQHPASVKDTAKCFGEIEKISKNLFGGFASEGPYDFAAKDLDYVLYTSFNLLSNKPALCDEIIPFWQLVYHGIILSNPGTETVNYAIKDLKNKLKFIEFGGRPVAYIYSKFLSNHNYEVDWMGNEDLTCNSENDLSVTLSAIKQMYDEYTELYNLQYEFMERHTKVSDGIYSITYSNGTILTVDYNTGKYTIVNRN